jgi:hypothetical protein
MLHVDLEHGTQSFTPAALAVSAVVEEGRISGILGHDEFACATANEVFLHVQPLINLLKNLRLILFRPFVLPNGVLDACRDRAGALKAF